MTTVKELKDALRVSLENRGVLKSLKSELLSKLFETLSHEMKLSDGDDAETFADTKFLIHELILEFLLFENLQFSRSTFCTESGHGDAMLSRQTLCQTLQIRPTVNVKSLIGKDTDEPALTNQSHQPQVPIVDKPVPLLYYIVNWLKDRKVNPASDIFQRVHEQSEAMGRNQSASIRVQPFRPFADDGEHSEFFRRNEPTYNPCLERSSSESDLY